MTPEGWTEQRIEDVLMRIANAVDVQPNEQYQQIGIRSHAKGLFDKPHVTGVELGNKRVFWVEPDCFVVNIVFAWEQAVGKTTKGDVGKIASHRFPMYRPKNNKADVDYFLYLFKSKYGKHLLGLASPGGAGRNKTLGQKEFNKTVVSVPPVNEQTKIARILSTWDRAIEATDKLIANAEAQKKALSQSLLPSETKIKLAKQGNRQVSSLGEVCDFQSGPAFESAGFEESGLRLLRNSNIKRGELDWSEKLTVYWASDEGYEKYLLRNRDVVIAMDGYVGRSHAQIDVDTADNALLVQRVARLRPIDIDPDYLYALISSDRFFRHCERRKTATGIAHITMSDIREFPFIKVERDKEQLIGATFAAVNSELRNLADSRSSLIAQRTALMQQLLTGKRRVKLDGAA